MKSIFFKGKLKIVTFTVLVVIFATMTTVAFGIDNVKSVLQKVFISEEESQRSLAEGKQAVQDSLIQKQQEEKIIAEKNSTNRGNELQSSGSEDFAGMAPLVSESIRQNLSQAKKDELSKLENKGKQYFGVYKRQILQLTNQMPANQPRIKLADVKKIVSKKNFNTAIREIEKVNGCPDFEGGSGVTIKEYWLNNTGKERIRVIVEQKEIFYDKMIDEVTFASTERLK